MKNIDRRGFLKTGIAGVAGMAPIHAKTVVVPAVYPVQKDLMYAKKSPIYHDLWMFRLIF